MCVDADSRPPLRPLAGGAVDSRSVVLAARDGNRFRALEARAGASTSRVAVLVLPDVRGLHLFYEELALRFADAGIDALAIDYFGRTAGTERHGEDFEHMPHVDAASWDGLRADVEAAAAHLARGGERSIVTVGFCFGGRLSFLCAALPGVAPAGVVGFYGNPVGAGRAGMPAPVDLAPQMEAPVLGLFGGADAGIPQASVDAFRHALDAARREHELIMYRGAPHSFFDRKHAEFAAESADAWERVLAFIGRVGAAT